MQSFRQPEIAPKTRGEYTVGRKVGTALLVGALALLPAAPAEAHGGQGGKAGCREYVLPVSLDPGGPKDQRIDVTQCEPKRRGHGKGEIVVATPGAGYTKTYFDWPQQPNRYSYARAALKDGISTLSYTPVGRVTGKSSYPPSGELTLDRNVHVLRQVIDHVERQGYKEINTMGHSVGAGATKAHAATDSRVDAVILTGYSHGPRNPTFAAQYNYPANQDPAFQGFNLDGGYSTTRPGVRGAAFYGTAASRKVIDYDDAHKDVISGTLLGGYAADQSAPPETNVARHVRQPVLVVVGEEDEIFCTGVRSVSCDDRHGMAALERQYFSSAESVRYEDIPYTGHDLTTATTALYTADVINDWIERQ